MTRRLLAVALLGCALTAPAASAAPSFANCGPILNPIGQSLPWPASNVFWRVCGP